MCIGGKPKTPKIPDPQPLKQPEQVATAPIKGRKQQQVGPRPAEGTMLTGAEGVPVGSLNTGGNTLLGA